MPSTNVQYCPFPLPQCSGTFAVVSLMVGAVVDKGHVAWQRQELRGAMLDIQSGHNITHGLGESSTTHPGLMELGVNASER